MIIASHNSWSYLTPKKWWMKLIGFTAKCQNQSIAEQYCLHSVRCFDLRIRFHNNKCQLVHGFIVYENSIEEFSNVGISLSWLNAIENCYVRVLLDIRNDKYFTNIQKEQFIEFCKWLENTYKNIKFFGGRILTKTYDVVYNFKNNPTIEENYSSVKPPKILDDWFPWLYAKLNNKKILTKGTNKEILMIDFVDIK